MSLFEFTIEGPPLSHQAQNRSKLRAWRQLVRATAAARWDEPQPWDCPLRLVVTYYHDGPFVRIDSDNLVKPIQDALIGLIYKDDRQITDCSIRKTTIDGAYRIRGSSLIVLEAFSRGHEFVHVRVEPAPDHSNFVV